MADQAELQAKIAALSGQINMHKQKQQTCSPSHGAGHGRWSPYHQAPRLMHQKPFKNRSLHLNNDNEKSANGQSNTETNCTLNIHRTPSTKASHNPKAQTKQDHGMITPPQQNSGTVTPGQTPRELIIEGVRFVLQEDGSKLVRTTGEPTGAKRQSRTEKGLSSAGTDDVAKESPKRVQIAGIDFYRTKKGNLARAKPSSHTNRPPHHPQCETFTKHGTCPFGPCCKNAHDPRKIAICKDFFHKGSCNAGSYCDLSHDPTYHRVPICTHFLRGNCTNSDCRYAHVNISASAPVCRAFATLGYCSKGRECDKRHVIECPDYANKGFCSAFQRRQCGLPHIDRASTLRKAARRQEKTGSDQESDLSSDEEETDDSTIVDVDSDEIEEDMVMRGADDTHALTQQQDFVPFA